jgi:hypothetical protein
VTETRDLLKALAPVFYGLTACDYTDDMATDFVLDQLF